MKNKLSTRAEGLVQSLYHQMGYWKRLTSSFHREEIVENLASLGEPAVIPDLLPLLITSDKATVKATAMAIHRLVCQLKPLDYVHLDQLTRQSYSNWQTQRQPWYAIGPNEVIRLAKIEGFAVSLLGMASCHGNGFVRAEAIHELGKIQSGSELPFLLIRVNDWVEENRRTARDLTLNRIRTDYAHHLVTSLPLVLRLEKTARKDHSDVVNKIRKVLENPQSNPALSFGFQSLDRFVRWFCYERAFCTEGIDSLDVLSRALGDPDPYVRKKALGKLGGALPNGLFRPLLQRARQDPNMPIRRAALQILAEKYPSEAEQEFRVALLDTNIAIREVARSYFRRGGDFDFRRFYVNSLNSSGRPLLAAILGLGETGIAADSLLLESLLENPSPRIRHATIRGISNLNSDAYTDRFVLALSDASASVAWEATAALVKKASLVGGKRLWEVFELSGHRHGKRFALFLIARISKWDSLILLVRSLPEGDESLTELSQTYIRRWLTRYNRSFSTPTSDQLSKLRSFLIAYELLVAPDLKRELTSILNTSRTL